MDEVVLDTLCRRHGVRRLAVFGSVLEDRLSAGSDVDVLIERGRVPGLVALSAMELELEEQFGRKVDLRTYGDLSRYFRDDVRARTKEIHAA